MNRETEIQRDRDTETETETERQRKERQITKSVHHMQYQTPYIINTSPLWV